VESDSCSSSQGVTLWILRDRELAGRSWFPDPLLLVAVVLWGNSDLQESSQNEQNELVQEFRPYSIRNKEWRIETNTELSNKVGVWVLADGFDEFWKYNNKTWAWSQWNKERTVPLVPDLAIVPRLLMSSSFVIPTPLSVMVRVLVSGSALILMSKRARSPSPNWETSWRLRKRILSRA